MTHDLGVMAAPAPDRTLHTESIMDQLAARDAERPASDVERGSAMKRQDIQFLPNRPDLMGELRPEFQITHGAWTMEVPCGEPTLDAPESIARGSAIGFLSDSGRVVTQGHVSRPGYRSRGVAPTEAPSKPITSLAEFCAEGERLGLTAADLVEPLSKRPEFADCLPGADGVKEVPRG